MLFAPATDLETPKSEPDLAEAPKAGQGSGSSRWFPLDLEDYTRPPSAPTGIAHTSASVIIITGVWRPVTQPAQTRIQTWFASAILTYNDTNLPQHCQVPLLCLTI